MSTQESPACAAQGGLQAPWSKQGPPGPPERTGRQAPEDASGSRQAAGPAIRASGHGLSLRPSPRFPLLLGSERTEGPLQRPRLDSPLSPLSSHASTVTIDCQKPLRSPSALLHQPVLVTHTRQSPLCPAFPALVMYKQSSRVCPRHRCLSSPLAWQLPGAGCWLLAA